MASGNRKAGTSKDRKLFRGGEGGKKVSVVVPPFFQPLHLLDPINLFSISFLSSRYPQESLARNPSFSFFVSFAALKLPLIPRHSWLETCKPDFFPLLASFYITHVPRLFQNLLRISKKIGERRECFPSEAMLQGNRQRKKIRDFGQETDN